MPENKRKDVKVLGESEIEERMNELEGWEKEGEKISKQFEFGSFMDALAFIVKLAPYCEAQDHHPDMTIMYKKVKFELQRFDVGGKLTNIDFDEAKHIEKMFEEYKGGKKIRNYSGLYQT